MHINRHSFISVGVIVALVLPFAAIARNFDQEYRNCARDAMKRRDDAFVSLTIEYHGNRLRAFEGHRGLLFDAWGIENDKDRNNVMRSIDKDFSNIIRDHEKSYRTVSRDIETNYRNDERGCRDAYNGRIRDVPSGAVCTNSDQCRPPLGFCTTETGECRSNCRFGDNACIQECTGRCKVR